jgi:hypothetical protein
MPGHNLIVPDDIVLRGGWRPHAPGRRRMQGYVLVGIALSGWVGFVLLAGVLLLVGRPAGLSPSTGVSTTAAASVAVSPRVLVGPVIVADPWTPTAFPIQVGPDTPREGWIRIAGVPALASLSAGHTIGRGVWKVPLSGLASLAIMAPARETLRSELQIALMSPEGAVMGEVQSALAVIPPALCGAVASAPVGSLPDGGAARPIKAPPSVLPIPVLTGDEDRRRAEELVLAGEMQRLQRRFSSARGSYAQAAAMGSPRGAMALAATFDPHEIAGTSLSPDIAAARAWYKRSRELMDASITYYLKRLEH